MPEDFSVGRTEEPLHLHSSSAYRSDTRALSSVRRISLTILIIGGLAFLVIAMLSLFSTSNPTSLQRYSLLLGSFAAILAAAVGYYFGTRSQATLDEQAVLSPGRLIPPRDQLAYTDLFAQALRQLGSERVVNRVGGIYLLELVGSANSVMVKVIGEVLSAFIRMHGANGSTLPGHQVRPDVQAAMVVLGRLRPGALDLRQADLRGLRLEALDFAGVDLSEANLEDARLDQARFVGANLASAILRNCSAVGADFSNALLQYADLSSANLAACNFSRALLTGARLTRSFAVEADFSGALLADADLTGTDLRGAQIETALLLPSDLGEADLNAGAPLPQIGDSNDGAVQHDGGGRAERRGPTGTGRSDE